MKDNTDLLKSFLFGKRDVLLPDLNRQITRLHDDHDGEFTGILSLDLNLQAQVIEISTDRPFKGLRYRNFFGGGMSLQTHTGLRFLQFAFYLHKVKAMPEIVYEQTEFCFVTAPKQKVITDECALETLFEEPVFYSKAAFQNKDKHYSEEFDDISIVLACDGDMHTWFNSEKTSLLVSKKECPIIYNGLLLLAHGMLLDEKNFSNEAIEQMYS